MELKEIQHAGKLPDVVEINGLISNTFVHNKL